MVRTVPRSSVAKWPDSGATSRTRGCAWSMSFLKCSSVPNGVTSASSSRTCTSRLPTLTWSIPKGGRAWVRPARAISSYAAVRLRKFAVPVMSDSGWPIALRADAASMRTGAIRSDCA